jgi:hypothetical protein
MRKWMVIAGLQLTLAAAVAAVEGDPVNLLFIHHSCGGQLLADTGAQVGEDCIYASHPNGGGLRSALATVGFQVHEASYGSVVGEDTDVCHWNRKFNDQMDRILHTARQDQLLPSGETNAVVVFKSCYTSMRFAGPGDEPGDPDACEQTLANARAAYRALLPALAAHPEVLFVAFTPPPLTRPQPVGLKAKLKAFFQGEPKWAKLGRQFATWLADPRTGWLAGYQGRNIVVFDYYDLLAGDDGANWSIGGDSHPSAAGNRRAAAAFVPFLQNAWQAHQASRAM